MGRERIPAPPSSITGELGDYLLKMATVLNNTPQFSYFSGATPNSILTGLAGDFAVNIGSASSNTRVWFKAGSPTAPSTTSWFPSMVRSFHTFSVRTAASLDSTNLVAAEMAVAINASGASIAVRSGSTIYYWASSASTLA